MMVMVAAPGAMAVILLPAMHASPAAVDRSGSGEGHQEDAEARHGRHGSTQGGTIDDEGQALPGEKTAIVEVLVNLTSKKGA
jgi:hypothetical protein